MTNFHCKILRFTMTELGCCKRVTFVDVCLSVCKSVYMDICMYICTYVCIHVHIYVCMYVLHTACMHTLGL